MRPVGLRTLCLAAAVTSALSSAPVRNDSLALHAASAPSGGAMLEASQKFLDFMLATFVPELDDLISTLCT